MNYDNERDLFIPSGLAEFAYPSIENSPSVRRRYRVYAVSWLFARKSLQTLNRSLGYTYSNSATYYRPGPSAGRESEHYPGRLTVPHMAG